MVVAWFSRKKIKNQEIWALFPGLPYLAFQTRHLTLLKGHFIICKVRVLYQIVLRDLSVLEFYVSVVFLKKKQVVLWSLRVPAGAQKSLRFCPWDSERPCSETQEVWTHGQIQVLKERGWRSPFIGESESFHLLHGLHWVWYHSCLGKRLLLAWCSLINMEKWVWVWFVIHITRKFWWEMM